jgi:nucleoside-diphosphate-sugar epimerase
MQTTVLILGARGRFGLAAARAFADAGWKVLGQIRPGAQVPAEAASDTRIRWMATNLHDTVSLAKAATGAAVVVHALNPAYTHKAWKAQVLSMTEAATQVARTLQATLMVPGNVYNFGEGMPAVLREDTPQVAKTVKGQIRIAMESQLRRSGVRTVVIRAGDFFGSGKGTWFDQVIVKDLHKGRITYPGGKDIGTAWAYLPDLARAFVAVAAKRAQLPTFEVLHFAGHTVTGQQWVEALSPLAQSHGSITQGSTLRLSAMPWSLIRLGSLLLPTWAALVEMRYLWITPHALANDKLLALLGNEPHTPLAQAAQTALVDLGLLSTTTGAQRHAAA